jgi:hypothetical protein
MMRKLVAVVGLLASLSAHAAPASEASVENLLAATKVESLMDSMYAGMEQMMRQAIQQGAQQAAQGKPLTAEQQRFLDGAPAKFIAVARAETGWQKMKPLYVQIYRDTFEQEEVDGLLAFYTSPAGQAFVAKMPIVMQKSLALSQSLMQTLIPKMTAAMNEAMQEALVPK